MHSVNHPRLERRHKSAGEQRKDALLPSSNLDTCRSRAQPRLLTEEAKWFLTVEEVVRTHTETRVF